MNSCKYFIQRLSYYGYGKQASERHFVVLHLISYSSTLRRRRKQLRYFGLLFVTARLATRGSLEERRACLALKTTPASAWLAYSMQNLPTQNTKLEEMFVLGRM